MLIFRVTYDKSYIAVYIVTQSAEHSEIGIYITPHKVVNGKVGRMAGTEKKRQKRKETGE